ncbi:Rho GTPase-activating protein 29 [Halotydeus destructor]|nr:Rho GTPase-activating protein 29 [Halotydeus destructor]
MPCNCNPSSLKHRKSFNSSSVSLYSDLVSVGLRKGSRAAKSHKFQMFTWELRKVLFNSRCQLCEKKAFLKTYQCSMCGLHGHRRCLKETVIECPTYYISLEHEDILFGQSLANSREMVPLVVWKCVYELERRTFKNLLYLYEADGPVEHVQRLVRSFNLVADLVDLSEVHYATIGSLLKKYLLETADPLLQISLRSQYLEIANNFSEIKEKKPLKGQASL